MLDACAQGLRLRVGGANREVSIIRIMLFKIKMKIAMMMIMLFKFKMKMLYMLTIMINHIIQN